MEKEISMIHFWELRDLVENIIHKDRASVLKEIEKFEKEEMNEPQVKKIEVNDSTKA
jgi:hypothetical protein